MVLTTFQSLAAVSILIIGHVMCRMQPVERACGDHSGASGDHIVPEHMDGAMAHSQGYAFNI